MDHVHKKARMRGMQLGHETDAFGFSYCVADAFRARNPISEAPMPLDQLR